LLALGAKYVKVIICEDISKTTLSAIDLKELDYVIEKNKKKVYVVMKADILHHGNINILKIAASYRKVNVGLLTDSAVSAYKSMPSIDFDNRMQIFKCIGYVDSVIE